MIIMIITNDKHDTNKLVIMSIILIMLAWRVEDDLGATVERLLATAE